MTTPRRTLTAREMRRYFEQTGFNLTHRNDKSGKPEAWWLADGDGTPYPMPAHWRPESLKAGQAFAEVAEFPSLARLWRAWAATQHRFAREAQCIELIKDRMAAAPADERHEVIRWARSSGLAYWESPDAGPSVVDYDGGHVDETRWPWCAMRWMDGQMSGEGWPWAVLPEPVPDGLEVQKMSGWPDRALWLRWFDTRYAESYFEAVRAVLVDVLPELAFPTGDEDGLGAGTA